MSGHDKGSAFEREVCKIFSLWWTDGERDDVFWRNRTRVSGKTTDKRMQGGDITAMHPEGLPFVSCFAIECKNGYARKTKKGKVSWDLLDLIDGVGKKPVIMEFWKQAIEECSWGTRQARIPLLVFKRDFHALVISLRLKDVLRLEKYIGHIHSDAYLSYVENESSTYLFFNLNSFLRDVSPESIKEFCKGYIECSRS